MSRLATEIRSLGHHRWFAALFSALVPVDRALGKLTKGRFVALGVRDIPSMLITTTGRKSGEPRTNPLLYAPDGAGYVVVGSNWGKDQQPAWALNLLACPDATVTVGGRAAAVRATLATGAERDRQWRLLIAIWPAYDTYVERAHGRDLMVFRLAPVS